MSTYIRILPIFLILAILDLHEPLAEMATILQNLCSQNLNPSKFPHLDTAIVCGTRPPETSQIQVLRGAGLIHLLVVSGAHLLFLNRIWSFLLPFSSLKSLKLIFLLFYTFVSGLQWPVVRAYVHLLISHFNQSHRWGLIGHQRVGLSGLITIGLFPSASGSTSLLLSWYCALGMSFATRRAFLRELTLYLLLLIPLAPLGVPNPLSIVANAIVAPLFGLILFPLLLLAQIFAPLTWLSDRLWSSLLHTLEAIDLFKGGPTPFPIPRHLAWGLLLLIHLGMYYGSVKRRRQCPFF